MKKVMVALDGSAESETAAVKAAELSKALGAKLTIVCVAAPGMAPAAEIYAATSASADVVEHSYVPALLFQTELACRSTGVVADTTSRTGPVADTLADMAESEGFDLVVVGHRGRGAVRRALLGSVADRLTQICTRPVLVIR